VRRQGEVVQKLAHMIGHSVKLYDMVLQFLRTLFLRTKNIHYCTLRAELLMALHDLEVNIQYLSTSLYYSSKYNQSFQIDFITTTIFVERNYKFLEQFLV